mgnify:CR=1 FL=1
MKNLLLRPTYLYSMNVRISLVNDLNKCVQTLQRMNQYDDVTQFICDKFGNIG